MVTQPVVEQQSKTDNIYMTMEIKDYGPISKGIIHLKPLTVFVGPTGCGKSYVSTLIHAVVDAESDYYMWQNIRGSQVPRSRVAELIHKEAEQILQSPDMEIKSNLYNIIADFKSHIFQKMIQKNSTGYEQLIRSTRPHFELKISSKYIQDKFTYSSENGLKIEHLKRPDLYIALCSDDKVSERKHSEDGAILMSSSNNYGKNHIIDKMIHLLKHYRIDTPKITNATYFPTERDGLTLAHRTIISDYYRYLTDVDISLADTKLSYVTASFLRYLVLHADHDNDGEFAPLVKDFERIAFSASVITKPGPNNLHDVYLRRGEDDFPLHATSTSVKNLAVFLLFVKHAAKPGDLIILEEPEAHLDPHTQTLLAKLIAQLVNHKMYVVINTHSPYFLEQLSHCVMASSLNNKKIKTLQNDSHISPNDVVAYEFIANNNSFEISPIKVDSDGIPQRVFIDVDDKIYDEHIKIIQADYIWD